MEAVHATKRQFGSIRLHVPENINLQNKMYSRCSLPVL
jgi:hypothetical protein